jgi:drug/metabolite transporter (DMT)-like permease
MQPDGPQWGSSGEPHHSPFSYSAFPNEVTLANRILTTSSGTNREAFTPLDWALFLAISGIWGSSFLLIAIGLDAFEPGLVTWLRVGLGALVLALVPRARQPVAADDRPRLIVLSVLWVGIPFTLFPIAQQHVNSAVAGMLNGAVPVFTAVVASVLLRRLPRGAQLIGLIVGFAGVALMSLSSGAEGSAQAFGVALLLIASLCYGLSINIATPLSQRYGSLPVMARMLALATVWTAPLGFRDLLDSRFDAGSLLAVLVLGAVGTGVAFVVMGALAGRVGSTRSSFITYLIPVIALALGVVFRDDRVTVLALVGVALVIAGALLASRRDA